MLHCVLLSDLEIRALNRRFFDRSSSTDVIAFAGEGALIGEIAVSLDTARRQARARRVPMDHELMLLATHGLLHLGGLDDGTLKDWRAMRIAEFEAMVQIV